MRLLTRLGLPAEYPKFKPALRVSLKGGIDPLN